jgi:hypothetical protein
MHGPLNVKMFIMYFHICAFGGFSIISTCRYLKIDSTYLEFLLVTLYIFGTRNGGGGKKAKAKELIKNIITEIKTVVGNVALTT